MKLEEYLAQLRKKAGLPDIDEQQNIMLIEPAFVFQLKKEGESGD
ncbi:hypothetical protein [Brevibacillus daliensis]|nr:hypothetical protein [Brevibacillus daliensis]